MENNIIKEVNTRIDQILASRDTELSTLSKKLHAVQEAAADAHGRMEAAIISADTKAYQAAKLEESKTMDLIEMYTNRLNQLDSGDLVSSEEDAKTVNDLQQYQEQLEQAACEKIIALISQIEQIGKEYYAAQDEANATVNRWERETHAKVSASYGHHPHRYPDGGLRSCISEIVTSYYYRKQVGADRYFGPGSIWTK